MPLGMRLREVEAKQIRPRWRAFIADALVGSAITAAAQELRQMSGKGPAPRDSREDWMVANIRRDFRNSLPEPKRLWQVAEALRRTGRLWYAGPLLLFAAGKFERFVHVMSGANVPHERLLELLHAVEGAIRLSVPGPDEKPKRKRKDAGPREAKREARRITMAKRERIKAWREGSEPAERRIWTLTPREHAAFDAAFNARNPASGNAFVAAATLACEHPTLDLAARQDVVIALLDVFLRT